MKKLLCIFFSIIIFVSPFLPVSGQASENKATNTVTADEFVKKISNMMYESENENFQKSETEFLKEKNEFSKFDSCRLIVKSSKKIDTFGAVQTQLQRNPSPLPSDTCIPFHFGIIYHFLLKKSIFQTGMLIVQWFVFW